MTDFIYERKKINDSITVEEISGGSRYSGKVWQAFARQIYCENGRDGYREIGHFSSGAPFLYNADERVSISHTDGMLTVASRKVPSDLQLSEFHPKFALGIDVERADRVKVLKLRERFLTEEELKLISPDSPEQNIVAWTAKEAMYKAALTPGINWRENLLIKELPTSEKPGKGLLKLPGGEFPVKLNTYNTEGNTADNTAGYIVTVCH